MGTSDNSISYGYSIKRGKQGQITLVIILGIVLIAIFAIFFVYSRLKAGESLIPAFQKETADTAAVRAFVESCIKNEVRGSVRAMAGQGGWVFVARESVAVSAIDIPIGYKDGKNLLPSRQEMTGQLATLMDYQIRQCANFSEFEKRGLNISTKNVASTPTISDQKITLDVFWPITIKKGSYQQTIDKFLDEQSVVLGDMHRVSSKIIAQLIKDPLHVDYLFLNSLGYNVTMFPYNLTTLVFTLTEPKSQSPLLFQFAASFSQQLPPRFDSPLQFTLKDEQAFFFDFQARDPNGGAEGEDLLFSDDTAMFDILPDGKLVFVPEITGEFNATVTVTDPTGLSFSKKILFEVVENS